MRPVLTVAEMRTVDEAAQTEVGLEVLVGRAGRAAARAALRLLGGGYGRRVVVIYGKGNNGADGRVAAAFLAQRGAAVEAVPLAEAPLRLPPCDLVLDAALGTGARGAFTAPEPPSGTPVLALDLPSGLDADTGEAGDGVLKAAATVTFGALKPGLLLGEGPERAGRIEVAEIGLDCSQARQHLLTDGDLAALPERPRETHKWRAAVHVVAGAPGMPGAAALAASGALRAGAGMLRLGSPGLPPGSVPVTEAVAESLPPEGFAEVVLADAGRFGSLVLGPGLGRAAGIAEGVRRLVAEAPVPTVLDADGLNALAGADELAELVRQRSTPLVCTPHDGEFGRLAGAPPGADRLAAARDLARRTGAVVLLKGSTTCVAAPDGEVLLANAGSPALATGGTGDVLAGIVGAFLARGVAAPLAAALAAHVHGRAAALGPARGLVASDLPPLVARFLSSPAGRD